MLSLEVGGWNMECSGSLQEAARCRILSAGMNPARTFHYVYVLQSLKNGNWYTGCTSDLQKRLAEHNEGKSKYTKNKGLYKLIYYEASLSKQDAFARERYLKSGMGKRYIKNRLKKYFDGVLTG